MLIRNMLNSFYFSSGCGNVHDMEQRCSVQQNHIKYGKLFSFLPQVPSKLIEQGFEVI